jgi:hypothetical protein
MHVRSARIIASVLALLAAVIFAGAPLPAAPHPQLTIAELRKHPDKYDGQVVRLSGRLTECAVWECSICPKNMTSATADARQCLALEFRSLLKGTGFGAEAKEAVFRFSSVTLTARFDPGCLLRYRCTDRASVLFDADVVSVETRRNSRSGLWLEARTALTQLTGPDADAIATAAHKAGFLSEPPEAKDPALARELRQFGPLVRVFGVPRVPDTAIICWAPPGMGADVWPDSAEGALLAPSPSDYFHCASARKIDGQWILQVSR